jgi:hypothetical protein
MCDRQGDECIDSDESVLGDVNGWHHYVVIYDDDCIEFYVDGEDDGSGCFSDILDETDTDVTIGYGLEGNDGQMDEVIFFGRAITTDEIGDLLGVSP